MPSYNRFPDEKGTESEKIGQAWRKVSSYNRFPDEKGTERLANTGGAKREKQVTTVSPMKRGLKAAHSGGNAGGA